MRDHLLGGETSDALARRLFDYVRRGLPSSALADYPKRVTEVTPAAVERLFARCRATSCFSAVGDERKIRGAWPGGR